MGPELQDTGATSDDAASAPSPEEEFDAVLSEVLEERETPAKVAVSAPKDTPLEEVAESPAPAEPAAAPEASEADPSPSDEPQDDIWASADPKLRQAYDEMVRDSELRLSSYKGRLSASDKELNRLRSLVEGGQQQNDQQQPHKTSGEAEQGQSSSYSPEQLEQLREEYPDLAGPILDLFEAQNAKLQQLEQGVGSYQQERAKSAADQQLDILVKAHPDWANVVTDDRFEGWLSTKPTAIQEAYNRNANGWVDGQDAALVVGMFKADVGFGTAPQRQQAPQSNGNQGQGERRARQLANGRDSSPPSPSVSATGPDPQDIDGLIDLYSKRSDARIGLG